MSRALAAETGRRKGESEEDFWRIRHRLPRETREYVPLMLAAALVGKQPEKYGLGEVERWMPLRADTVSVPGGTELGTVARAAGVDEHEVTRLNPHLVRKMTPPGKKDFSVRIPDGHRARFEDAFPALHAAAVARAEAEHAREVEIARERAAERRAAERRAEARRVAARRSHASSRRSTRRASAHKTRRTVRHTTHVTRRRRHH